MDALSKLTRALAAIRRTTLQSAGKGPRQAALASGQQQQGTSEAHFRAQVAARIKAVRRQDPDFRGVSTRVFLEQVLLRELGEGMLNSRQFQETVRDVQRVMEGDSQTRTQLHALIDTLVDSLDEG